MASLDTIGGIHYEMMRRCYNPNCPMYKCYGAKGIVVCDEWHDREKFREWAINNGYIKGLRLQRIDSNKSYSPDNCIFGLKNTKKDGESQYHKKIRKERIELKERYGVPNRYNKLRVYRIYTGMISRCNDVNNTAYKHYGGRGISVCKLWSGKYGFFRFYRWAMDNGYSDDLSIDRIDNDKGYSPNNCRWVGNKIQIRNRRNSKNYIFHGNKMNLSDISKEVGISYGALYLRICKKNMSVEDAIEDAIKGSK